MFQTNLVTQTTELFQRDTFIICDAGGGTVDLISYKIVNLNPLKLNEFVGGTGDLYGSIFLNERFKEYMRNLLGDQVFEAMKPKSRNEMMRTWEEKVKFKFGNTESRMFDVSVLGILDDDEKNIDESFHTMDYETVKNIFDPVADRIVELVSEQARRVENKGGEVAAILLVGGFGSSEYLLKRLEEISYGGRSIKVHQSVNARLAIARGALIRGLDGSIVRERRARRNYGSCGNIPFQFGKGWDSHKFYDPTNGNFVVPGSMNWFIKKDAVIESGKSYSRKYSRLLLLPSGKQSMDKNRLKFTDELYSCDLDDPPGFEWENPQAIKQVCRVHSDLSTIPLHALKYGLNSMGQEYAIVNYFLKLSMLNEVLTFECLFDGQSYGRVSLDFED